MFFNIFIFYFLLNNSTNNGRTPCLFNKFSAKIFNNIF